MWASPSGLSMFLLYAMMREKPFVYVNRDGQWKVFVPGWRYNATGPTWTGTQVGESLPLSAFHIAREGQDSAASMNAALSQGKHLLITTGRYNLTAPLQVNNPNQVVLGMGLATLIPQNGVNAIETADVDGIILAGLLIDAGPGVSPDLVRVGPVGSSANHASNPIILQDMFIRVGGGDFLGTCETGVEINSNHTILDHTWIWRADHGAYAGYGINNCRNGLIVNGDDVKAYGNHVEHFDQHNVVWNGDRGENYFLQCEFVYDPDSAWNNGASPGWAAWKVSDSVSGHKFYAGGCYAVFTTEGWDEVDRVFEVPTGRGVELNNILGVSLSAYGRINNLVNNDGIIAPEGTTAVARDNRWP